MTDRQKRFLTAALMLAIGLPISYAIARAGEPQSAWLWCLVGRLC